MKYWEVTQQLIFSWLVLNKKYTIGPPLLSTIYFLCGLSFKVFVYLLVGLLGQRINNEQKYILRTGYSFSFIASASKYSENHNLTISKTASRKPPAAA